MSDVLVLVPTYNERESLKGIIARIRAAVPDADVLIIDDSSPDGTGQLADTLAATDHHVSVLHRPEKEGLGRAYLAGFRHALDHDYHYVVEIDADGSHDPAELPAMVERARGGADLVIGSRWVEGGGVPGLPWFRSAISRVGNGYAKWMLRSDIHDLTAGYRVFRADTLRHLDLATVSSQGYCFQIEMTWDAERAGLTVVEHPIEFAERAYGESKMRLGIVLEAFRRVTVWGVRRRA